MVDWETLDFISMLNRIRAITEDARTNRYVPLHGGIKGGANFRDILLCNTGLALYYDNSKQVYEDDLWMFYPLIKGIKKDDALVFYDKAYVVVPKDENVDNPYVAVMVDGDFAKGKFVFIHDGMWYTMTTEEDA